MMVLSHAAWAHAGFCEKADANPPPRPHASKQCPNALVQQLLHRACTDLAASAAARRSRYIYVRSSDVENGKAPREGEGDGSSLAHIFVAGVVGDAGGALLTLSPVGAAVQGAEELRPQQQEQYRRGHTSRRQPQTPCNVVQSA